MERHYGGTAVEDKSSAVSRDPARVLRVLKYYRPDFTGEGLFMERCTGFMQMLAPEVRHELLVTTTPEPAEPPQVCGTLSMARARQNAAVRPLMAGCRRRGGGAHNRRVCAARSLSEKDLLYR